MSRNLTQNTQTLQVSGDGCCLEDCFFFFLSACFDALTLKSEHVCAVDKWDQTCVLTDKAPRRRIDCFTTFYVFVSQPISRETRSRTKTSTTPNMSSAAQTRLVATRVDFYSLTIFGSNVNVIANKSNLKVWQNAADLLGAHVAPPRRL